MPFSSGLKHPPYAVPKERKMRTGDFFVPPTQTTKYIVEWLGCRMVGYMKYYMWGWMKLFNYCLELV